MGKGKRLRSRVRSAEETLIAQAIEDGVSLSAAHAAFLAQRELKRRHKADPDLFHRPQRVEVPDGSGGVYVLEAFSPKDGDLVIKGGYIEGVN